MVSPESDVEVHPPATRIAIAMDNKLAMDFLTETSLSSPKSRPRRMLRSSTQTIPPATLCLEPDCVHVGVWQEAHRFRCPSHRPAAAACTCGDQVATQPAKKATSAAQAPPQRLHSASTAGDVTGGRGNAPVTVLLGLMHNYHCNIHQTFVDSCRRNIRCQMWTECSSRQTLFGTSCLPHLIESSTAPFLAKPTIGRAL
jgi:hypothetical protein